ncbi:MAG: hypothetical protein ACYS9X_30590 [Planctomycetota bacterium]|jgi:hypothetical protein
MLIDDDVHPESLMKGISDTPLRGKLLMSVGVHVALVLVTSIGFIALCATHGSLDPHAVILENEKRAEDEKREAERLKRQQEAEAKEKSGPGAQPKAGEEGTPAAGSPDAKAGEKAGEKDGAKTPVEKRTTETSEERPDVSDLELDLDDL